MSEPEWVDEFLNDVGAAAESSLKREYDAYDAALRVGIKLGKELKRASVLEGLKELQNCDVLCIASGKCECPIYFEDVVRIINKNKQSEDGKDIE
jgi:hypothetical protein